MTASVRVVASLLPAVLMGLVSAPAAADPVVVSPDRPILMNVLVVYATQEPGTVDPPCRELRRKLQLMNFQTLKVMQQRIFKLRMGESAHMALPTGHKVEFLPITVIDKELHMQVQMPEVVNTRVRTESGRGVILGGVPHDGGYVVVQLKPVFRVPRMPSLAAQKKRAELTRIRATPDTSAEVAR